MNLHPRLRDQAWATFADLLGDNPDVWAAALLLVDSASTMRELADLATATAGDC